jgi:hypothetical protein
MSWTWTVLPTAGGAVVKHCVLKHEAGLHVSVAASGQWLAQGDGTNIVIW